MPVHINEQYLSELNVHAISLRRATLSLSPLSRAEFRKLSFARNSWNATELKWCFNGSTFVLYISCACTTETGSHTISYQTLPLSYGAFSYEIQEVTGSKTFVFLLHGRNIIRR